MATATESVDGAHPRGRADCSYPLTTERPGPLPGSARYRSRGRAAKPLRLGEVPGTLQSAGAEQNGPCPTGTRRPGFIVTRGLLNRATAIAAATVTAASLSLSVAPAQAATYYGRTARSVAKQLHCVNFVGHGGGGTVYKSGVCYLSGKRVNVITFSSRGQQRWWNAAAKSAFGTGFYWGNGTGALVVAKNGNRPAAALGAR